jgi:hypothetical protein
MFKNAGELLIDPMMFFLGKYAYKYGLSKTIRVSKEDTTIYLQIVD